MPAVRRIKLAARARASFLGFSSVFPRSAENTEEKILLLTIHSIFAISVRYTTRRRLLNIFIFR